RSAFDGQNKQRTERRPARNEPTRNEPTRNEPTRSEPARDPNADYQVRTFQRDDLDIPAFLRRQRTNNGRS
ncbi:MAG: hypothetical protein ACKO9F_15360, partial [Caldilinea sp.]